MLYKIEKRLLDIIGALVGLTLFSPIMLVTAVFIKFVSPSGPVMADIPNRVGKDKSSFRMYKFRSMIPNASEWLKNNPELYKKYKENNYKLENDPRWLPGAAVMRKYSIDEMPQFLNILKGDMSIVGPRAYYPFELEEQIKKDPDVREYVTTTLTVKPGLTGPWQIGGRSAVNFKERIKMDADYAQSKSILYDISIILRTPLVVITGRGAV